MRKLVSRLNSLKIGSLGGGLILLLTVTSAANGQFGAPEPSAKEGKIALETGYFRFSSRGSGVGNIAGDVSKFKQNRIYVQAGYGLLKNWEAYIRLGGADFELDNAFTGNRDFEDSFKPFGTLGIRGLVYQDALFGVGPFFQATKVFSNFTDTKTGGNLIVPGAPATEKMIVRSPWDFGFGMSAQIKPAGLRPDLCRNSFLRYPCLKNFFHNWFITKDLHSTKAHILPVMPPPTSRFDSAPSSHRCAAYESDR